MSTTVVLGVVKGEDGKINNSPSVTLSASDGVTLSRSGTELTLTPDTAVVQEKITGEEGQIVAFDVNGNPVAIDDPFVVTRELYGFELQMDESEPSNMIRYIGDNAAYTPAGMDFTNGVFNYGDWGDAFFIKNLKPCMLNYNGTVAYDLDKNDYTKKADGTASDVANSSFAGNAMVGIPTVWVKIDTTVARKPKFYFSNEQLDENFKCYAHHDNNGDVMPYTYMAIYPGWSDGTRLRSISGKSTKNTVLSYGAEITKSRANNPSGSATWDMDRFVDRQLINLLLLLIGKSTNAQSVFGWGNETGYLSVDPDPAPGSDGGYLYSGTLNNNGLFFGYSESQAKNLAVKVFGMENWYGNGSHETIGIGVTNGGDFFYKLTYGTEDGTSATGFDVLSMTINSSIPSGWLTFDSNVDTLTHSGEWVSDVWIGEYGLLPKYSGATSSTKYCSRMSHNDPNAKVNFMVETHQHGLFSMSIWAGFIPSGSTWSYFIPSICCKPTVI